MVIRSTYSCQKPSVFTEYFLLLGKSEPDNWESQIKVPLYLKWPKKWKGGWTINITITLLDVMPTILELMNQSFSNETIDGKSLLPLLSNSSDLLHKFVFHYIDVTCPSAVTYGLLQY